MVLVTCVCEVLLNFKLNVFPVAIGRVAKFSDPLKDP